MGRVLKTKFPCRYGCGRLAGVERLSDGPRAVCDTCSDRISANRRIVWSHESASDKIARVNGKADTPELVRGWLEGIGSHLRATALRIESLPKFTRAERRKAMVGGVAWVKWARDVLAQLEPMIEELAADETLPVIDGGPDQLTLDVQTPATTEAKRPALRLIRADD